MSARLRAASDLAAAISLVVLLQQCEIATGRPMVTLEDRWRVQEARRAWARCSR